MFFVNLWSDEARAWTPNSNYMLLLINISRSTWDVWLNCWKLFNKLWWSKEEIYWPPAPHKTHRTFEAESLHLLSSCACSSVYSELYKVLVHVTHGRAAQKHSPGLHGDKHSDSPASGRSSVKTSSIFINDLLNTHTDTHTHTPNFTSILAHNSPLLWSHHGLHWPTDPEHLINEHSSVTKWL